jgi:hypothetical protein
MTALILFGILVSTAMMAIAKRAPALVRGFRGQSFFLFCATLAAAFKVGHSDFFGSRAVPESHFRPASFEPYDQAHQGQRGPGVVRERSVVLIVAFGFYVFVVEVRAHGDSGCLRPAGDFVCGLFFRGADRDVFDGVTHDGARADRRDPGHGKRVVSFSYVRRRRDAFFRGDRRIFGCFRQRDYPGYFCLQDQ